MKKLIAAVTLTLALCLASTAIAEDQTKTYEAIFVLWEDHTSMEFISAGGGQQMQFYMIGDCLVIKDTFNGRTWLFEGKAWRYIDAKVDVDWIN